MRESVRPKTKWYVICDMCVMLCVRLLRSGVSRG